MIHINWKKVIFYHLAFLLCYCIGTDNSYAKRFRFQWSPRISISQQYDDNFYLADEDADGDWPPKRENWLTAVKPGIQLNLITAPDIATTLDYDLGLFYYARPTKYLNQFGTIETIEEEDNFLVRHNLALNGFKGLQLTKRLTLDLDEFLQMADDPIEANPSVVSTRRIRRQYIRNTAGGRINVLLKRNNSLYFGGHHTIVENDDPQDEDVQGYGPSAGINYWLNKDHGLNFDYSWTRADYDRPLPPDTPPLIPVDEDLDTNEHQGRATYTYIITPKATTDLSYQLTSLEYDSQDKTEYKIHTGVLGLSYQFTPALLGRVSGGYSQTLRKQDDDEQGFTGTLALNHVAQKGTLTLSAATGFRRQSFEGENTGLSNFYQVVFADTYQITEKFSTTITAAFNQDNYLENFESNIDDRILWEGSISFDYTILKWLSSSFRYEYRQEYYDYQNIDNVEYIDNRVTLTFTAFYLSDPVSF